jgi:hypothetical protein
VFAARRLLPIAAAASFVAPRVAVAQTPAHLDVRMAEIREEPPMTGPVGDRRVTLRIGVRGGVSCAPGRRYGFLVDTDSDAATGLSGPFVAELGLEAQLVAACPAGSAAFQSALGPVTIAKDPKTGLTVIEISTTVKALPAVAFRWVGFARDGSRITRVPVSGFGFWTTSERAIP